MDFVWVVLGILALVSSEQSLAHRTEQDSDSCFARCPAGYFKAGDCMDSAAKLRCEKCPNNTYTEKDNDLPKCILCTICGHYQETIEACSRVKNTKCDCKKGLFRPDPSDSYCYFCDSVSKDEYGTYENNEHYKKMCLSCQSDHCMKDPECKKKCPVPSRVQTFTEASQATTAAVTITSETSASVSTTEASNTTANPVVNPLAHNNNLMFWCYLVLLMTFLVLLLLLVYFRRNLLRDGCLCWSTDKAQDLTFNEQRSDHGNSPTTLTFTISEESPIMSLCHEPPTHISPCLPQHDHIAPRQDKQSDRWPAIVLYAIIKEVPLRRWKEFLRLLSLADQEMERVELEAGLGSIEKQYQMLRLWSQRSSASLNDIYSSLHYMELSGCAQHLQESLEKLQWRPEERQGVITRGGYTEWGQNEPGQNF